MNISVARYGSGGRFFIRGAENPDREPAKIARHNDKANSVSPFVRLGGYPRLTVNLGPHDLKEVPWQRK
jgi:hypothetical protein